jgi:large subunit ribosomal protein L10
MAITKAKKADILGRVREGVKKAKTLVFVNFHGLSVAGVTQLRQALRADGVEYYVAKKTLIKKAFSEESLEGTIPELPGEIALAYGEDLIAPAKGVYEFQKKNPDVIKIVGGVFEGRYLNAAEMTVIAAIPPREVLYGQFVNLINSPIQGLAMAIHQIAEKKS